MHAAQSPNKTGTNRHPPCTAGGPRPASRAATPPRRPPPPPPRQEGGVEVDLPVGGADDYRGRGVKAVDLPEEDGQQAAAGLGGGRGVGGFVAVWALSGGQAAGEWVKKGPEGGSNGAACDALDSPLRPRGCGGPHLVHLPVAAGGQGVELVQKDQAAAERLGVLPDQIDRVVRIVKGPDGVGVWRARGGFSVWHVFPRRFGGRCTPPPRERAAQADQPISGGRRLIWCAAHLEKLCQVALRLAVPLGVLSVGVGCVSKSGRRAIYLHKGLQKERPGGVGSFTPAHGQGARAGEDASASRPTASRSSARQNEPKRPNARARPNPAARPRLCMHDRTRAQGLGKPRSPFGHEPLQGNVHQGYRRLRRQHARARGLASACGREERGAGCGTEQLQLSRRSGGGAGGQKLRRNRAARGRSGPRAAFARGRERDGGRSEARRTRGPLEEHRARAAALAAGARPLGDGLVKLAVAQGLRMRGATVGLRRRRRVCWAAGGAGLPLPGFPQVRLQLTTLAPPSPVALQSPSAGPASWAAPPTSSKQSSIARFCSSYPANTPQSTSSPPPGR
jgi:hypothetical protein